MLYNSSMRTQQHSLLPPLAFGHRIAKPECSIEAMESKFSQAKGWETQYEPIGPHEKFANQSAELNINGLHVMAVTTSPMRTRVKADSSHSLFIPLTGKNNDYHINGYRLSYGQGENAIFCPEGERVGKCSNHSILIIDVNKERVQQTITTMLGHDDPSRGRVNLSIPHSLKLRVNDVALDDALMQLCGLIDQFCSSQSMLEKLAIDDSIYRIIAMMFQPDYLIEPTARIGNVADNRLNAVCEYATANLGKTITLTELERESKLSARTLKFAAGYKQRFGELPSATLARSRS